MTDIDPMWHPQGRAMFDVGRVSQLDAEAINNRLATFMGPLLQAASGTCTRPLCRVSPMLKHEPSSTAALWHDMVLARPSAQ